MKQVTQEAFDYHSKLIIDLYERITKVENMVKELYDKQ